VSGAAAGRPLLSVIVPAYNEEAALPACLRTLLAQTYPAVEVIVVDDGSSDGTVEVARRFPVRVLGAAHRGPAAARNLAARRARGEILVFVDADMTFDPAFLDRLTEPVRRGAALGTFTTEEFVANPENRWARCWSLNLGLPPDRRLAADHPPTSTIFRALPRERFLEVGGFDEGVGYTDDDTLAGKLGGGSAAAPGAICYHENPPRLREVYRQARWIGRGDRMAGRPLALVVYSPPVSLLRGLWIACRRREPSFLVFKLVHDLGMLAGILSRLGGWDGGRHAK
jgi:glycosyltransferase involved in cell wall biosynthesis